MDNIAKPVKAGGEPITQAGSSLGPNTVPPHLQPPEPNQTLRPTEQDTEADKLHPKEAVDEEGQAYPQDFFRTSPIFYEVANFLGIEDREFDNAQEKIATIIDWAQQETGSKKAEDILMAVRELEDQLQPPGWDEKRYNNLYKYLRLATKEFSFRKAMGAFRRDGGKSLWSGKK